MKDLIVPVLEEQVSLIMTLGRVVYMFQSYGPSPDEDRFADHMLWHIPNMESDFRKTNDFEKLAKDLWYIRCIAKQYDDFVREFTKVYGNGDFAHIVNIGHSACSGKDMEGEYTFNNCPYASGLGEFPSYNLRLKSGECKDPHEGWEELDLSDVLIRLIPPNWLEGYQQY